MGIRPRATDGMTDDRKELMTRPKTTGPSTSGEAPQLASGAPLSTSLAPSGELTIFEVAGFHQELVRPLGAQGSATIDLSRVERLDASALQLLIAAHRSGRVTVTGLRESHQAQLTALGYVVLIQSSSPSCRWAAERGM